MFSEQSENGKITLRVYDKNRKNVIFETKSTQSKPTEIMIEHPDHAVSKQFFKAVKDHYGIELNPKINAPRPRSSTDHGVRCKTEKKQRSGDAVRVGGGDTRNTPTQENESFENMERRFNASNLVKLGEMFNCAYCNKAKTKKTDDHKNCSAKCRNAYNKLATRRKETTAKKEDAKSSKKMIKQGEVFKIGLSSPPKQKKKA